MCLKSASALLEGPLGTSSVKVLHAQSCENRHDVVSQGSPLRSLEALLIRLDFCSNAHGSNDCSLSEDLSL